MSEGPSIVNLGNLSKPVTVLIEKISDAVGGYFKPYQIERVANAEAKAELIKAQAQIEITDLQRRALNRFIAEEAKKQENIESIAQKAFPLINDSATPQKMDDDWIANFFEKCRIISDKEMQSLWAKVLAGEANAPGTYSKRTVNFIASLDKAEANLFTTLCGYCWTIGAMEPLIYDIDATIYNSNGITFNSLLHLNDISLINFNSISAFARTKLPQKFLCSYFDAKYIIQFKNSQNNQIELGHVVFTNTGRELVKICGLTPVNGFSNYIIEKWKNEGIITISPLPSI